MKPLNWGLIGAGDIVRKRVAPALRDSSLCRFVAVSRARAELAAAFAAEFGAAKSYEHWRDLLTDGEIEAVYIATPVHLHAEQTIATAEAGKHVLCEKPMALDVGECDRMLAACRASNVRLGIAYYRRFYPVVDRIKDLIASGEIGQPVYAQINAFEWCDLPRDDPRAWFLDRARAGGGPMFDFGCHRLEVLLNLLGPVQRITGLVANVVFHARDVEDTAAALLQFERGACAVVAVTHAAREARDTLELFGTRGSIHVGTLNRGDLTIKGASTDRLESHPPATNFHQPLIEDFVQAVRAGRDPAVGGDVGREVARMEEEIYAAWRATA